MGTGSPVGNVVTPNGKAANNTDTVLEYTATVDADTIVQVASCGCMGFLMCRAILYDLSCNTFSVTVNLQEESRLQPSIDDVQRLSFPCILKALYFHV